VLRTGGDAEKRSRLFVLYAKDPVDENLFKEYDWDLQLANAEMNHYEWRVDGDDILDGHIEEIDEPLPKPETFEREIPGVDDLEIGDEYTGPRRGFEFSVDSAWQPFRENGDRREFITTPKIEEAATLVYDLKGGGAVTINKANHIVTQTKDSLVFLGVSPDPETFSYQEGGGSLIDDAPDELDFM
jgi:hypothetical protein